MLFLRFLTIYLNMVAAVTLAITKFFVILSLKILWYLSGLHSWWVRNTPQTFAFYFGIWSVTVLVVVLLLFFAEFLDHHGL